MKKYVMKKYLIDNKQVSREDFYRLLQDAVSEEVYEEKTINAVYEGEDDTYERLFHVALQLLNENFEVSISDHHFMWSFD